MLCDKLYFQLELQETVKRDTKQKIANLGEIRRMYEKVSVLLTFEGLHLVFGGATAVGKIFLFSTEQSCVRCHPFLNGAAIYDFAACATSRGVKKERRQHWSFAFFSTCDAFTLDFMARKSAAFLLPRRQ